MATDQELAAAIEYHRMYHVKEFVLPSDCTDADSDRFAKEIQKQHPLYGQIVINFISSDPEGGGMLYPEGRKLDSGETWTECL
jgi:hypothetical protein